MSSTSQHVIRHAAWAFGAFFLCQATIASAANFQTGCGAVSDGHADCSLSLGNVVFTARGVNLAPDAPVFDGGYGHGYLNLVQADVVQAGGGQGIAFDPGFFSMTGYSGTTESAYGMHTVSNLEAVAAPGFVLNSVSVRFEGVLTLAGAANVTFYGWGQRPDLNLTASGDHPFDLTFTASPADLAAGNFPALSWYGLAINGQPLNGAPAVTGLIVMNLDKMTISASVSPVPESGTLAFTALGLVGIGLARARHSRSA